MDRKILDYLPRILREVQEVLGYADGQQWAFDQAWRSADRVFTNQFILDSDDYGLSRWEKMLKIVPRAEDTLEIRRNRILLRLREKLPFTLRMLRKHLELLCGEGKYSAEIPRASYLLTVIIDLSAQAYLDDVMELLLRMVPANLLFQLYVLGTANPAEAQIAPILAGQGSFSRTGTEETDILYSFENRESITVCPPFWNRAYTETVVQQAELTPVFRGVWKAGGAYHTENRLERR